MNNYKPSFIDEIVESPVTSRCDFTKQMQAMIKTAQCTHKYVSVVFLGLDRLHLLNHTSGMSSGDLILNDLAKLLESIIGQSGYVANLGGKNFGILVVHNHINHAMDIAEKTLYAIEDMLSRTYIGRLLSSSVGISTWPRDGQELDLVIRNADIALRCAKQMPGYSSCVYTPDMGRQAVEQVLLHTDLLSAISQEEFILQYQPKINLNAGLVDSCEALIRWQRAGFGLMYPDQFIPTVESSGLIAPLTDWVAESACTDIAYSLLREIGVSVNVSPQLLSDVCFPIRIATILERSGLDPHRLTVEITETGLIRDSHSASRVVRELKNIGVNISLDDFGTAYSSITLLRDYPIDELKIDRSFVIELLGSRQSQRIVRGIVDIAHDLGVTVVAEGVEYSDQYNQLGDIGCDAIQGYLVSPPLDLVNLLQWLEKDQYGRITLKHLAA